MAQRPRTSNRDSANVTCLGDSQVLLEAERRALRRKPDEDFGCGGDNATQGARAEAVGVVPRLGMMQVLIFLYEDIANQRCQRGSAESRNTACSSRWRRTVRSTAAVQT